MIQTNSDLLVPSRRGFVKGLAALFCAPAIVRASSLMPVKPFYTYGPRGLLNMQIITHEASKMLAGYVGGRDLSVSWPCAANQSYVDIVARTEDLKLPIEQYKEKILRPAMYAMSCYLGDRRVGMSRELPRGCMDAAIGKFAGVEVRGIQDYHLPLDQVWMRLDVTHD